MKTVIFLLAALAASSATDVVKPQTRALLSFTYQAGSTAAYPVGTGIIYNSGAVVLYSAGASVTYLYTTRITFPIETEFYTQQGPVTALAGTNITFGAMSQVAYGPGTLVVYATNGETRYEQFNGNTHAIASYPETTSVKYYYGPNGSNLILLPPGTNPLVYYNPGGSTQFGVSALPVEKEPEMIPQTKTYGYNSGGGGGGGYNYCGGYSYTGYPSTNYCNYNTGYRASCQQTGYNRYTYSNNGAYNMGNNYGGGGSYGGGSYGGGSGGGGSGYGK